MVNKRSQCAKPCVHHIKQTLQTASTSRSQGNTQIHPTGHFRKEPQRETLRVGGMWRQPGILRNIRRDILTESLPNPWARPVENPEAFRRDSSGNSLGFANLPGGLTKEFPKELHQLNGDVTPNISRHNITCEGSLHAHDALWRKKVGMREPRKGYCLPGVHRDYRGIFIRIYILIGIRRFPRKSYVT